jgi:hypothetical protein
MAQNKLLKIVKRQFEVYQTFFLGLTYSLMIGCLFGVGVLIIYDTFGNKSLDVTSLSLYYPFAIFAACAAICFSWVRAVDLSQQEKIDRIRVCAEGFLLSAILFLISSLFKYSTIHPINSSKKLAATLKNFALFMDWVFPILFIIAYLIGAVAVVRVLVLLIFKRVSLFDRSTVHNIEDQKNDTEHEAPPT